MKKKYGVDFARREKVAKKILQYQRNGILNVHQVVINSFFSEKEILDACKYLMRRGVLRANCIGANITISYAVVKNIF
jgi:hypothetical protein